MEKQQREHSLQGYSTDRGKKKSILDQLRSIWKSSNSRTLIKISVGYKSQGCRQKKALLPTSALKENKSWIPEGNLSISEKPDSNLYKEYLISKELRFFFSLQGADLISLRNKTTHGSIPPPKKSLFSKSSSSLGCLTQQPA